MPYEQLMTEEHEFTAADWLEELAPFQPGGGDTFSLEQSEATLVGLVPTKYNRSLLQFMLGYAYADNADPYKLHRVNPVQHPVYPWLYAKSVNIQASRPIGNPDNANNNPYKAAAEFDGNKFPFVGNYALSQVTVRFAQFPWQFYDDEASAFKNAAAGKEYARNCAIFDSTDPQFEMLMSETDRFLTFKNAGAHTDKKFPGTVGEPVQKTGLVMRWHGVPESFVFDNGIPRKMLEIVGKVNNAAFPASLGANFPAGVLIFQPPEFRRYQQPLWLQNGAISFAYEIILPFQFFDPPAGSGSTSTVRGHNLFPYARGGGTGGGPGWYEAQRPDGTLYLPSANFEKIFEHVNKP